MLVAAFLFDAYRTPNSGTPDNGGMIMTAPRWRRLRTEYGDLIEEMYW